MRSVKNATPPFVNAAATRFGCNRAVRIRPLRTATRRATREAALPCAHPAARNLLCLLVLLWGGTSSGIAGIQGLPFSRTYSLDEIGYVSRGSRLNFDAFDT